MDVMSGMAATQTRQVTAESVRKFAGMTGDRNPQAATGTIKAWRDTRSMGSMEFTVQNQDGETVLRGEATVYRAVPDVGS